MKRRRGANGRGDPERSVAVDIARKHMGFDSPGKPVRGRGIEVTSGEEEEDRETNISGILIPGCYFLPFTHVVRLQLCSWLEACCEFDKGLIETIEMRSLGSVPSAFVTMLESCHFTYLGAPLFSVILLWNSGRVSRPILTCARLGSNYCVPGFCETHVE